jgi:formylglycine-generating enzyme required for sulfatase activity
MTRNFMLLCSLGYCLLAAADEPAWQKRLPELVKTLGDERFAIREQAVEELAGFPEEAIKPIRQAIAECDDPEARHRLQFALRRIIAHASTSKTCGMQLVLIDPGEFIMGSPVTETDRQDDEQEHRVRITPLLLVGVREVTQEQYEKVLKMNPSWFSRKGGGLDKIPGLNAPRNPVEQVTWYDAVEFCVRLSELDGYEPCYTLANEKRENGHVVDAEVRRHAADGYRLPTEAEWEYACRAGTRSRFSFGTANSGREANVKPGLSTGYGSVPTWPAKNATVEAGNYPANPFGLCDMHGNVAEWCDDWYAKDYYEQSPKVDPKGPATGKHRVLRGGSWLVTEGNCRSASRFWMSPGDKANYVGFRVVRAP